MIVKAISGSFRDPSGRVYSVDDRIVRTVSPSFAADFEFVESTGLLPKLVRHEVLLSAERVDPSILGTIGQDAAHVLEVSRLPFVSFPYEWSFPALKAAALLHLDIHLTALEHDVTLSDASAYNIQFQGHQPIFIDHLSFRRYREGERWVGYRQFCEQFLNPLLLRALFGIPHNSWYRGNLEGIPTEDLRRLLKWRHHFKWKVLTHVVLQSSFQRAAHKNHLQLEKQTLSASAFPLRSFKGMLHTFRTWISGIKPADKGKTIWREYANTHTYSFQEAEQKKRFVREFAQQVAPKLLWDLGCNTGDYAKIALEAGAKYVIGFDNDHGALEAAYARAQEEHLAFLPLWMDAANPTPNQGWREQERQSLHARASADALLALAVVHHLAIARNIPLDQVVNWLIDLAPKGVMEFIPKGDPMVQKLLALREDIFPDYTQEHFLKHLTGRCTIVKTELVSSTGRLLVWYERS